MWRYVDGGYEGRVDCSAGALIMAILIDSETRVICQGMTGWAGTHHTATMMDYGTKVVAGVTPGKGGTRHLDLPVFNTVREAAGQTKADASIIFAPPDRAAGAMVEAIEAELPVVVTVTERVPVSRHAPRPPCVEGLTHATGRPEFARNSVPRALQDRRHGDGERASRNHNRLPAVDSKVGRL